MEGTPMSLLHRELRQTFLLLGLLAAALSGLLGLSMAILQVLR